ncbi:hypothetical protein GA0070617_3052 [Micromonospora yangpuensis]|uniref:Uncharacterized protein n=1 Tax=Micromonospora yangpuensis TaxID=683228 RepID=A0A1C6UPC6_9ACTN|nr:hypothetical protein GA0070617_3052 [Micromonospora yangpuensis]
MDTLRAAPVRSRSPRRPWATGADRSAGQVTVEVALAEFTALRNEIDNLAGAHRTTMHLHVTAVVAVVAIVGVVLGNRAGESGRHLVPARLGLAGGRLGRRGRVVGAAGRDVVQPDPRLGLLDVSRRAGQRAGPATLSRVTRVGAMVCRSRVGIPDSIWLSSRPRLARATASKSGRTVVSGGMK